MKYYIISVGDAPEDGFTSEPFSTMTQALKNISDGDLLYYVLHHSPGMDWLGPYVRGWHGNLSSIYIFGVEDNQPVPTYEKDILPLLHKKERGEIELPYDEE